MKKSFLIVAAMLLGSARGMAVPAFPDTVTLLQPDGHKLSVLLHGDEWHSYMTTTDGYTVINEKGVCNYALLSDEGKLISSGVEAHNVGFRTVEELRFIAGTGRTLVPPVTQTALTEKRKEHAGRLKRRKLRKSGGYDYSKFRGLVVLVEFDDRSFLRPDSKEFFDRMINSVGYDGYTTLGENAERIECTGSVRDYFFDNSNGLFDPHFDIYGPVKVNRSVYDVNKYINAREIGVEALSLLDPEVDFSRYDTDGDGIVDMVFFLYAGAGSNTGNDQRLLWPHASSLTETGVVLDGVSFDSYACSTELSGIESLGNHDGIGTICHEFSHVLGLFDVYDTDYTGSGGQSTHPGRWSIMASGSYLNNSRTPCGYSMFEREWAGFASATPVESGGDFSLGALSETNQGLRIASRQENEYFLIENRQQSGWDAFLPGHGMLVFRVDFTDEDVWLRNVVNNNPQHNYYELLRANPVKDMSTGLIADTSYDPFPGNGIVTEINNNTSPSLRSWGGLMSDFSISDIEENRGTITFHVNHDPIEGVVEDFENMKPADGQERFSGLFCDWILNDVTLADSGHTGMALAFRNRGTAETSVISNPVQTMTFEVFNPGTEDAKVRLYTKKNGAGSWIALKDYNFNREVVATAGGSTMVQYDIEATEPASYRIMLSAGGDAEPVYVDNVSIESTSASSVLPPGDETAEGLSVLVRGREITVTTHGEENVLLFDLAGSVIGKYGSIGGKAVMYAPHEGFYIVVAGCRSHKVMVR